MPDYPQNKKLAAEEYLAEHRAHWLLEHITTELVLLKPVDPVTFIERRINEIGQAMVQSDGDVKSSQVECSRYKMIVVLGGPSSGKTLVCAYLNEQGLRQLDVNNIILEEIKKGTEVGKSISNRVAAGESVPNEALAELVKSRMTDPSMTYVIEGFPRTMEQVVTLELIVGEVMLALLIDCPETVQVERMTNAQVTPEQQKLSMKRYLVDTFPVVEYYKAQNKLVTVNAATPKEIMLANVKRIAWN